MKTQLCGNLLALLLTWSGSLSAQVPETDLYLFQLTRDDTSRWHIHSPVFLSGWNNGGYTNQPEWINEHTLLVSALRPGGTQNDIYLLDLRDQVRKQMTESPESEFSPLLTPDKNHFSVIRQVHGGDIDQQVFQFPLDLSAPGQPLFPEIRNAGYHCWLDANTLALFLVDDPVKLAFASLSQSASQIYSSNIGRSLRKTPNRHLAYVHKYSDTFWFLKTVDPASRKSEILIETLYGKEDFTIGPSGEYFMGSGSTLYVFDPKSSNKKWMPIFDLSIFGITHITRLAVNGKNQIAIVNQKERE